MTTVSQIDYTPLSTRPTDADLAELRAEIRNGDLGGPSKERFGRKARTGLMVFGLIGGFLGLIFGIMALVAWVRGNTEDATIGLMFTLGVAAIGVLVGWGASRSDDRHWAYIWQLVTFARANGLEVEPNAKVVLLPGSIFVTKRHATTSEKVSWTVDGHAVEAAFHHRASGGPQAYGSRDRYLAVRLGDSVPRLTFDAARGPARGRRIAGPEVTLSGGKLTTLVAGRDAARAFMNEEVVALLTDKDHPCNAEANGGWFFVYYRAASKVEPAGWGHMIALADALVRSSSALRH